MIREVGDHGATSPEHCSSFIVHRCGRNPLQQVPLKGNAAHGAANPPPMLRMDTPALAKGGYTLGLTPIAFLHQNRKFLYGFYVSKQGALRPAFLSALCKGVSREHPLQRIARSLMP